MRQKAVVFGCSGQDGSYMCKFLLNKGYKVTGTSRSYKKSQKSHLELGIKGKFERKAIDILKIDELTEFIEREKPNEIYNFSAQSSVGESFNNPIETQKSISLASINLLEACKKTNFEGRIFFAGSSEIFGETITGANIDSVLKPCSPYAIAKIESMMLVKLYREKYKINAVTGVLFPHESILRNERFVIRKIINAAVASNRNKNHKEEFGNINIARDWGWAEEYMEAIYLITNRDEIVKDHVVCTGKLTKLATVMDKAFRYFDLNWQDHIIISQKNIRVSDIESNFGNPKLLYEDLNWESKFKIEDIIKILINDQQRKSYI